VGFEPTVGFPTLDFESSALNRTQPPFQSLDIVNLISACAISRRPLRLQKQSMTRAFNGAMNVTLTDGGIETRIIYEFKRPIGDFEAYQLLADEAGRDILRRIYQGYAQVAVRYDLPIQLGTPTWRASRRWTKGVGSVNAAAVELLRVVRQQLADAQIILARVIGPASDGYATDEALSADAAFAYHRDQANVLAELDVDFLHAPTVPASRNCLVLRVPWQKPVAHMRWHRCCTPTARCSTGHRSRTQLLGSMPRSRQLRITI
jgi:S-methylmethionine-dependent homocysteine/selenocysteine methylase